MNIRIKEFTFGLTIKTGLGKALPDFI